MLASCTDTNECDHVGLLIASYSYIATGLLLNTIFYLIIFCWYSYDYRIYSPYMSWYPMKIILHASFIVYYHDHNSLY